MNIETYEKIFEINKIDMLINEAELEYERDSKLVDAREALDLLRKKYFG